MSADASIIFSQKNSIRFVVVGWCCAHASYLWSLVGNFFLTRPYMYGWELVWEAYGQCQCQHLKLRLRAYTRALLRMHTQQFRVSVFVLFPTSDQQHNIHHDIVTKFLKIYFSSCWLFTTCENWITLCHFYIPTTIIQPWKFCSWKLFILK